MRVVCVINAEGDDIELLFPAGTPEKETLHELSLAGFKWNGTRKMWVARRSRQTFALAEKLTSAEDEPDLVAQILDFESGRMGNDQVINFFQYLIDTGMVWTLQGGYGRLAQELIKEGYCHVATKKRRAS